jgi:adenosylmethionine-8-amino-7-oxononanoate aminotransferase
MTKYYTEDDVYNAMDAVLGCWGADMGHDVRDILDAVAEDIYWRGYSAALDESDPIGKLIKHVGETGHG